MSELTLSIKINCTSIEIETQANRIDSEKVFNLGNPFGKINKKWPMFGFFYA